MTAAFRQPGACHLLRSVRAGRARPLAPATGFSLVELIVVIVITAIMAAVTGIFVADPIRGFIDQSRRASLVDSGSQALTRMERDVRRALPNSIRVSGNAVELLRTLDGDRYRAEAPGTVVQRLQFTGADGNFNVFGTLLAPATYLNAYLSVYPLGTAGANPYVAADGVLTAPSTITVGVPVAGPPGSGNETPVALAPAHAFPFDSPSRRIYLVQGPVSYLCQGGTLWRFANYGVQAGQPATLAAFAGLGATGRIVAQQIESCAFVYQASATALRGALLSMELVLVEEQERIRLMRQIHVDNVP